MSGWPIASLGSVVKFISGGTPSKDEPRFWCGDIPWVSSAEMTQRWISDTQLHVTEDGAREGSRRIPKNTVLAVVRGMSLAKEFRVAISQRDVTFNQDLKALLPTSALDPVFLFFYLLSQNSAIRDSASEAAHGTKKLDMPVLEQWPIPVPPLATQQKIAAILSAYDDLIANNQRRIALLERMAEDIYREWFVRLRFPGYEQVKVEKGVPQGWSFDLASTFFSHVKGKSYGGEELSEDQHHMPFITLKSFNRGGGYRSGGLKYYSGRFKSEQLVQRGDIVMAVTDMTQNREVVGRAARVPDIGERGAVISLDVIKLVPHAVSASFLYSYLRLSGFGEYIKEFANGTNVLHLKPDVVTAQKVLMPPANLQTRFDQIAQPIYRQIDTLNLAVTKLESTRDALLPRLISGQLAVDGLDIRVPPGMAANQDRAEQAPRSD